MFLSIGEGPHRDPLAMGLQRAAEGLVRNTGQAAAGDSADAALSNDCGPNPKSRRVAADASNAESESPRCLVRQVRSRGNRLCGLSLGLRNDLKASLAETMIQRQSPTNLQLLTNRLPDQIVLAHDDAG